MKQLLKVLTLVLVLVLAIGVLVACNDDPVDPNTDPNGNGGNGGGEGEGSEGDEFEVTFKYIDREGNPLKDTGGYTEYTRRRVEYGDDVRSTNTDSVQAFDLYVITGWNADKEKAMAGEADENCTKNITKNTTLYSVIRDKVEVTVTLLKSDGTLSHTQKMLEGAKIDASVKRPVELGKYFKAWDPVKAPEGTRQSSVSCVYSDCSFKAIMGSTDGTIGKVAEGAITVDGKKDAAYAGAAYLAHNGVKQADNSRQVDETYTNKAGETVTGDRAVPNMKADTWMVWDGNAIYLLIEVYDTTLTTRSDAYVGAGIGAWCNDAVEIWYTFEQDATITENKTRIGLSAMGDLVSDDGTVTKAAYALGRDQGINGGRSTHFDEIEYAVRNRIILSGTSEDVSDLSLDGVELPSYIMEFKFPAYTEGEADMDYAFEDWDAAEPQKELSAADMLTFKQTGRLYGKPTNSNNKNDYRFTSGQKLEGGNFVQFCLQINDLKISRQDLNPQAWLYLDSPTPAKAKAFVEHHGGTWDATYEFTAQIALYEWDATNNKLKTASTRNLFCASGSEQYKVSYYLIFSLNGENSQSETKVFGFKRHTDYTKQILLDALGEEYTRGE